MFLMTARVSRRRLAAAVCVLLAVICGILWCLRPSGEASETLSPASSAVTNEDRVRCLSELGWKVSPEPKETMAVRIPRQGSEVFARYNELQKSQGFDLSDYAGKKVMRYVYTVEGDPGAADPVLATLLIYRDRVIGGDVTDTAPGGKIRGLARSAAEHPPAQPTVPASEP